MSTISSPSSPTVPRDSFGANENSQDIQAEYVYLGKSGLRISVPIFGCMSFGDPAWAPWVIEEESALPLLKAAYDRGLNTWDTANVYSNGRSEQIIGKALKVYNIPRHKIVIMTKCCGLVGEEPGFRSSFFGKEFKMSKDYVNQSGLSRQAIFNAVSASLTRLSTDYIDLLQIHRFDPYTPIEETMSALHSLVLSGKVRYIGASSMWATQFARMQHIAELNSWTKFISMHNQYSLLYREEEREMNRFCNDTGVGLVPWAPLSGGHLARRLELSGSIDRIRKEKEKGLTETDKGIIMRVEKIAMEKGWTMGQVALAWINRRVSSPVLGFSSTSRIHDALGVRGKILSDEEERYLEELYVPKHVNGHV